MKLKSISFMALLLVGAPVFAAETTGSTNPFVGRYKGQTSILNGQKPCYVDVVEADNEPGVALFYKVEFTGNSDAFNSRYLLSASISRLEQLAKEDGSDSRTCRYDGIGGFHSCSRKITFEDGKFRHIEAYEPGYTPVIKLGPDFGCYYLEKQ